MIPKIYHTIYADTLANPSSSIEKLASDWALSSAWGDTIDLEKTHAISEKVCTLARMTVADLAKFAGMSNRQFALSLGVPIRTMENWSSEVCTPPDYVKLLIVESIGYFDDASGTK